MRRVLQAFRVLAQKKKEAMMAISIPPVPEGILTPANLYGDVYGDLPPLEWANPDLHSRLAWIGTQRDYTITAWHQSRTPGTPGFPALTLSTMFRAEVSPGVGMDFDVRSVMMHPDLIVYALMRLAVPGAIPAQLKPYPGFAALNPVGTSPIGAAWPEHPWRGRAMFHDNGAAAYKPGDVFETEEARYQMVQFVERPGNGPFGTGGQLGFAWERVYSR